jgi:hypothetical protein
MYPFLPLQFSLSCPYRGVLLNKQLIPTGGSRTDGTVRLSYEYGAFEIPKLDGQQGMSAAQQRCVAWGYTGAEPFGGSTNTCTRPSNSGCMGWLVTVEYQCTGSSPDSN